MNGFNSADLTQLRSRDVKNAFANLTDAKWGQASETYQRLYDSALKWWKAGKKKQAIAKLEMALEAVPDRVDGWCRLGEFYDELGSAALLEDDHEEADRLRVKAMAALMKAIMLSPAFAEAHYALANVYWGRELSMALAELETAAKCDPQKYQSVLERARTTVRECTYQLARMNVIILNSAQEMRSKRILQTDFFFVEFRIGCAVMHRCVSDNQSQWAYVWLFEAESPDLNHDEPVAELSISATGDVSISVGCPADYHSLKVQAAELGVLTGWLGANGPPAAHISANKALVENAGTHVGAGQAEPLTARDDFASSRASMATARDLGAPDSTGSVLAPATAQAPEKETPGRAKISSMPSQRHIFLMCLGAVVVAAVAGQFYFEDFGAPPTSNEQAHVSIESPGLLLAADATPESVGIEAPESVLNAQTLAAGSPSTDSAAPLGSADPVRTLPIQGHDATRQASKIIDPQARPRLPESVDTEEATQVTVLDPLHKPTTTKSVVSEPKPAPMATLVAESTMERLRKELAQCGEIGSLQRMRCVEQVRWNHCHPDKWNKSRECAAQ